MNPAHLDYETLADLAEGLLDDDLAASATEHLDECGQCRERSAELVEVSRLLAETPVPPMPAELTARIDAVLAAEVASAPMVMKRRSRRGPRVLWVLSAAASVAVLAGGGVLVTSAVMDSPVRDNSGAVTTQAVQEQDKATAASRNAYAIASTGTDYRYDSLGVQVAQALRQGEPSVTGANPRIRDCVARLAGERQPLLVDADAGYGGHTATIIVFPGPDPDHVDVWVTDTGCSTQSIFTHVQISR